jgi:ATP-dependent helicase/nuclease subunit A
VTEFTTSQFDAIAWRKQDACVVAGPGSGKTTVLVERFRSLVEDHHFDPRQILAITFTEKAAANMKAKLAERFAHNPELLRDLEAAYVSTIHGFCARILRENAIAAGIDPRFSVLDARESEEMQYACLNKALDDLVEHRRAEALELIGALQTPWVIGDLRNAYDAIRSAGKAICEVRAMERPIGAMDPRDTARQLRELVGIWPAQMTEGRQRQRAEVLEWAQSLADTDPSRLEEFLRLKKCPLHLGRIPEIGKEELRTFKEKTLPELAASAVDRRTARFRAMIFDVLERFDQEYRERKKAAGSLDFSDLEHRTIQLLQANPEVRNRIRAQFRQIMLDEFQDINNQQAELIRLIRGEDVFFAVGDINQSIYGFRHARPEIFEGYRTEIRNSGKHSAELLDNFRSRNEILRCVETLLNLASGIDPRELVAGSSFAHKAEPSIEILKILGRDSDEAAGADKDDAAGKEARWIAHRILSLRGTLQLGADGKTRGADFSDFTILCRNSDSMKPILDALDRAAIPYVCGRRQSFLLSRACLDITALLHTIANPRDGISLVTVLRSPLAGISDEALLRIRLLAGSVLGGLNLLAYDSKKLADFVPADARRLERFIHNLQRWRAEYQVVPVDLVILRALSHCGFQWTPGTVVGDNIESFLHLARTRGGERGLVDFLHEIESLQNAVSLESDLSDADQGNCVQVMTAHAAKGLEFPIAIIAAMDKGTQRNSAPATFTPDFGLGLKWKDPFGKPGNDGLEDSWQLCNARHFRDREKQEAHRLLYVAMTRAEEHLILSYSRGRNKPSNWAKIVDTVFQLDSAPPANEPRISGIVALNGDTFNVSVQVADGEPPVAPAWTADRFTREDVPAIPRPAIDAQHDSVVNVTSLAVFADCPRKYYIQRYIGWNGGRFSKSDIEDLPESVDDELPETAGAELGSLVHAILAGKQCAVTPEAQRLANVFLQSGLGVRAAAAMRSAREWDFIMDIDGTLVRGTIDLWFEEAGEIHVVDYKTDAVSSAQATERAASYAPQIALYALALERAFGKRPVRAWLHFLRPDTLIEVPLDKSAVDNVLHLLAQLRTAQNELRFDLREGEHCRSCPFYRGLCPAGGYPSSRAAGFAK